MEDALDRACLEARRASVISDYRNGTRKKAAKSPIAQLRALSM